MRYRRIRRTPVPYPARPPIPDGILVHRVFPRPTAWSDPVDPAPRFRDHHQVSSSARRRRSDLRWSGTGGCLVRPVRLVTRRLLVVPPDLDTPVPVAEPLVPFPKERASVVAVLPEHDSGASPGSRSSVRHRSLSPCVFWWIGSIRFRIPAPCSAWTHHGPGKPGDQPKAGLSPGTSTISTAHGWVVHSSVHSDDRNTRIRSRGRYRPGALRGRPGSRCLRWHRVLRPTGWWSAPRLPHPTHPPGAA